MPGGKVLGRLRTVEVSTDGGTTWLNVGRLTDSTWNGSRAEINATDGDSGDSEEYMAGRANHSLEVTARYDEANEGQQAVEEAFFTGTTIKARWRAKTGVGEKERTADAIVTACSSPSPDGDTTNLSATIRITGAVTRADQAGGV